MLHAVRYVTDGGNCRSEYVSFWERYSRCLLQEGRSKRLHDILVAFSGMEEKSVKNRDENDICLGRIDTQLSTKDAATVYFI